MSSIALSGNAAGAGVFTIASPNSASSYTIKLPAVTGGSFIASDASGNVGIGTTAPLTATANRTYLSLKGTGTINNDGLGVLQFQCNSAGSTSPNLGNIEWALPDNTSSSSLRTTYISSQAEGSTANNLGSSLGFATKADGVSGAGTERMRLDSTGRLFIGKTAADSTVAGFDFNGNGTFTQVGTVSSGTNELVVYNNTSTGGQAQIDFRAANVEKGNISWNNTATTYNTSSDYRLKENVVPMTGALSKVAALKPCTYSWKIDGSAGQGFIAHELAEVCPQAVTGEKDGVREDGITPRYQGIDVSFLVATLTAAIQEQQALITSLTARIAALEGATP